MRDFQVKHNYAKLKRIDFSAEVQKCFDKSFKFDTIKSGFKCCGLYPFDKQNIDYDKLLSKTKKYEDKVSEPNQSQDSRPHTQQIPIADNEEFKKQFETRLSPDILNLFREAGDFWTSDSTYEKLFTFWKNLTPPAIPEN